MLRKTLCILFSFIALQLLIQNSQQMCHDHLSQTDCEQQCYPGCQWMSCFVQKKQQNLKVYNFSLCVNITKYLSYYQGFCGQQLNAMSKDEDQCCKGEGFFDVNGCNNGKQFQMSHRFANSTAPKNKTNLIIYIVIGVMLLVALICCKYWDDGETEVIYEGDIVSGQSFISGQSDSQKKLLKVQFEDISKRRPSTDQKVMKLWNQKYGIPKDKRQDAITEMHNQSQCQTNSCYHQNVRSLHERKLDDFDKQ